MTIIACMEAGSWLSNREIALKDSEAPTMTTTGMLEIIDIAQAFGFVESGDISTFPPIL